MSKKIVKPKLRNKSARKTERVMLQSVKGMRDILPADQPWWDWIREEVGKLADYYNFGRIDTPILEKAELFEKTVGEATDIVEKQMFFVKSAKDRLVLRPENTAAVARAYIEHGLSRLPQPARLYYIGPMFRHEQPQEGRFRQFHQVGFEMLGGEGDPVYDAQTILIFYRLLERLKITDLNIQINTIGCRTCRPIYRKRLVDYYKSKGVCRDCRRRLSINPFRLLDCKGEKCEEIKKEAPIILDNICDGCDCHFRTILEYLEQIGLPYVLNNYLARGLDYYNRTVFEIFTKESTALVGGGRYDYLVEMLGGPATPAIGGAAGLERWIAVMKSQEIKLPPAKTRPKVFLIHIGNLAKKRGLILLEELRGAGIKTDEALGRASLRAQLKQADRERAKVALIFGQKEAFEDTIIIRDMNTGSQETVPLEKMVNAVKRKLK